MNFFQKNAKYIVILAVVASSTSGIFAKYISANSLVIGFYRQLFALPIFLIPVVISYREELKSLIKLDVIWAIISGIFLFGHFYCWFTAVKHTAVASAVVLAALHPLIVIIIITTVFKEKIPIKSIVGVLIAILGGTVVAGFDYTFAGSHIIGDILAILSAGFMGIYFVIGAKVRKRMPAAIYVMIVFGTSLICFFVGMVLTKTPFVGYPISDWIAILGATIICQIGAHGVWNWCMGYVTSLYVSAWETMEIVFATFFAFWVFGEIPTVWQLIGATVVIIGLLFYNYSENNKLKEGK
ncbi:MAG: DMT family transporter [Anaerovoracaceae bacterium]